MELAPCDETARQSLVNNLFEVDDQTGIINKKTAEYVAKTFPSILLDIARLLVEQATTYAKSNDEHQDPADNIRYQLRPYLMFNLLLGKAPQAISLMYSYFEQSSFQPLPENLFKWDTDEEKIVYLVPGFTDNLVQDILVAYLKYLTFNPKWFSAIWNWSELGRFISLHTNHNIRYIATCCLSIITKPERFQHVSLIRETIGVDNYSLMIDTQIKYRDLFDNTFKPLIETKHERAHEYCRSIGYSQSGYSYDTESLTKVANVLLLKRELNYLSSQELSILNSLLQQALDKFVPVPTLQDTISRIAYSISINKPCLIRGPSGSGKTAVLDYIAARTQRLYPPEYLKVQIGDQIDSKLLIGSYVCTEIPGQFEWQPGPLARAMAYGSWIVFEDIDTAPPDLAQVIHSVIENGNLSCISSCPLKLDNPHPDFRIFFTQRSKHKWSRAQSDTLSLGFGFVERLCDMITIPGLQDDDLIAILQARYKFGNLTATLLKLYRTAENLIAEATNTTKVRQITLRDLFKFCDRIASLKLHTEGTNYSTADLDLIFFDAVDCFLRSLAEEKFLSAISDLGKLLNKSSSQAEDDLFRRNLEATEGQGVFRVGRAKLSQLRNSKPVSRSVVAYTSQALRLLECVSNCIAHREPVLLVGETGVGKTTIVQHIANSTRNDLIVVNLSQQSDSTDLLGSYRPVEMREIMTPIHEKFVELMKKTWDPKANKDFLAHVEDLYTRGRQGSAWVVYLKLLCNLCIRSLDLGLTDNQNLRWHILHSKVRRLSNRLGDESKSSSMALAFSKGSLLTAIEEGRWILLDEVNLAEPEVLQCLLLVLDSMKNDQVCINAANEASGVVQIHPNFRIFACMNPSTDVGKKELPQGIRARFTEFFVDDIESKHDLRLIVESYVKTCFQPKLIENIVNFYLESRSRAPNLNDISGNSPVYSLRTLCRALTMCSANVCHNAEKSLIESVKTTFFQQLSEDSVKKIMEMIYTHLLDKNKLDRLEKQPIPAPSDGHEYINVEGFWIRKGQSEPFVDDKYILTDSIKRNLKNLSRIICLSQRRLPILIQGKTSVGKTSLVTHLAKLSGNTCYRINNHEHTDLQEYVGRYVLTENGELTFQEGLLVRALRKGYWLILDELNLAPCELLEALNRVLDDNRELFIPETRQTIKAHSNFVIFATQNPPEEYAGRKVLSRAFRNRFIELHFDEIPHGELEYILRMRCQMAPQHAKKIVSVMKELQKIRRESGCFNGKHGFMTMRDLFRWGERYLRFKRDFPDDQFFDWEQHIANEGLILLEGRVRTINEADIVKGIIEKVFSRKLERREVYRQDSSTLGSLPAGYKHIHFTPEFQRLFVQLRRALTYNEPVLLCGQTGCGKTTACQLYAATNKQDLVTYNCHLNTESSDFIGDVRPHRRYSSSSSSESTGHQMFSWSDGPLLEAMKKGSVFLMDEISLSDDAVLERINSVLEPERSITLSERDGQEIYAHKDFRFVATMNPGGDYGKKELSIALRNRFTEIYCHNTTEMTQVATIIQKSLYPALLKPRIAPKLIISMQKFLTEYYANQDIVSLRDILSWTKFINVTTQLSQPKPLSVQEAMIHGASLVFFDQFGSCGYKMASTQLMANLKNRLDQLLQAIVAQHFDKYPMYVDRIPISVDSRSDLVSFDKFNIPKGPYTPDNVEEFITRAPTVKTNLMKIVRAMQLDRPILLEGNPGAGKTSIISALAKMTGHKLTRINLSEQTDISDLFGSDLPDVSELNSTTPRFSWHDGPMLKAIKHSRWVLLDEMNLASQSVLEGLNACLDHRGEIFIPELGKRFSINRSTTRIFACQNPCTQGASRKGLPQSFLNRFTTIYIEPHSDQDSLVILKNLYPNMSGKMIKNMIQFNSEVCERFSGFDYEFNLRDLIYWCDLTTKYVQGKEPKKFGLVRPDKFVQFVYFDRMRSNSARNILSDLFEKVFGMPIYEPPYRDIRLGEYSFIMGRTILPRRNRLPSQLADMCILKYQMPFLESLAKAIECNKMPILVGETGVGKHSMVKILAGLTGNELSIIGANREMDTVELLGSYEQQSLQREMVELIEQSRSCVAAMINSISQKRHATTWTQLFKHSWSALFTTTIRDLNLSKTEMLDTYRFQLIQLKDLIENIYPLCNTKVVNKCRMLKEKIERLMSKFLQDTDAMYSAGSFEWVDSLLVKSVRNGNWLMIENANLLNPATLDRLNSLVEPNGTLCLNEKGSDVNGIEVLKPHPDFRLILTMDPAYGELSRAMRNRGVEIFVQTRFFYEDYLMLLNQNGFEPEEQKACMAYCIMQTSYDVHEKITGSEPMKDEEGSPLAHFGLNYISTLTHQVRRGMDVDKTLAELLTSFYHQKGFLESSNDDSIYSFVSGQMNKYRKTYEVKLVDERYKWFNLRHDLVSMSGGDAIAIMVNRDNKLFFEDLPVELLFKQDEIIENIDIVNTCIAVKIFLELSTHGDFEYRKGFIRETFQVFKNMMMIVNNHVDLLYSEYIPLINNMLPKSSYPPVSEMHIDTRNSPDVHHYLQTLDFESTQQLELQQNRWLLSLHRIMLCMIVELIEERSVSSTESLVSLWTLSEQVKTGQKLKEDLIRPAAEIASDLYDLLNGIMRVVSNRCFDNHMLTRMMPRFFWISYFICKLKRAYQNIELIALCNQLPMLWALTVQKVIEPIARECNLSDLTYKNKKFSNRILHISDFLDIAPSKPCKDEKNFYMKVINRHATTTKFHETFARDIDNFFNRMLGKYNSKAYEHAEGSQVDMLSTSNMLWTNSTYMSQLYTITDKLLTLDSEDTDSMQAQEASVILQRIKDQYNQQDEYDLRARVGSLSSKKLTPDSDQFSPVWQLAFLRVRQSQFSPEDESAVVRYRDRVTEALKNVNGLLMSPKYYRTIIKCLWKLEQRKCDENSDDKENDSRASPNQLALMRDRDNLDIYSTFLVDHVLENIVLDNQVVNWTKLRVTTSDLSSVAPLVPEYAPILSLVGSYCLDISHLKLNSHRNNSPHLDSLIIYLWRSYKQIKHNSSRDVMDIGLARNLIHYRSRIDNLKEEAVGRHNCGTSSQCQCIEVFIRKRASNYDQMIETVRNNTEHQEDLEAFVKAINLIYFGYYSIHEYAPIFTWDPALRSREKLEVYKAELAHIKLDLHARNTLFYWKTGENLKLNEIDTEDALLYPFATYVLVERRVKLERSIAKLHKHHTTRPKSDDGSVYYDLRKEVQVSLNRYRDHVETLMKEFLEYVNCRGNMKGAKLSNLNTRCRMLIRSLEKTILQFRSEYALYGDLLTHFLTGLCFLLQGLRRLYSRLEQKMQIIELGFLCSIDRFAIDIIGIFSFSNLHQCNLETVHNKLNLIPVLGKICPPDRVNYIQSILLKSALIQLNHHTIITPSDIPDCIKIVRDITVLFQAAWLRRKLYLEEHKKKQEELYRYKPIRTALGEENSFEQQEFIDICTKFPVYDHIFQGFFMAPAVSTERRNIETEAKIINLSRSVDLTVCIDICKAHYKFIKTASQTLLGYHETGTLVKEFPVHELDQLVRLEAEALYTILRQCNSHFDQNFDALSVECHLLQAFNLSKILAQTSPKVTQVGTTKSSIEILDEEVFDIYHDPNTYEALKLQEFMSSLESKVHQIRLIPGRSYENDIILNSSIKLIKKISSFLITDPLMKFITGGHTLLEKIEEWNRQPIPKEDKMHEEFADLADLLDSWRKLEVETWKSSLHRVRRKYTHDTLCDQWFQLYEAFNNPVACARDHIREEHNEPDFKFTPDTEVYLYVGFSEYVKKYLERSKLGDYQIRLDLVSSFAIQTRFASLYDQARPDYSKHLSDEERSIQVDFDKLTTYVYNTLRQYQGLFQSFKCRIEELEKYHHAKLNEKIKIFSWRNRNFSEVKKQLRNSHRILNSLMNEYLDLLKQDLPGLRIVEYDLDMDEVMACDDRQAVIFEKAESQINIIKVPSKDFRLSPLKNALSIVQKFQMIIKSVYCDFSKKTIDNFNTIEQTIQDNASYIENYSSHQVDKVIIQSSDSKEVQTDKQKQSRQMRHSRRFALQAVFKNLQNAGISYQRGLNNDTFDQSILELEPLRGMMQHQSNLVLRSASKLIDNALISKCNEMFLRLSANNMFLLAQPNNSDLSSDHFNRIKGYAIDMLANIIKNNQDAAITYKNFMSVQAASLRLNGLMEYHGYGGIVIYNYDRVHRSLQVLNKFVSRAYTALSKLDRLLECQDTVVGLESVTQTKTNDAEKGALLNLIHEIDPNDSLITKEQSAYIKFNLPESRRCIAEVSDELRDKLKLTKQNHLYSDDDIIHLKNLYRKFIESYRNVLPRDQSPKDGTILGSMCSILVEAERKLEPRFERDYLIGSMSIIDVTQHPNLNRLNLRLQKLIKETKLALQSIHDDANETGNTKQQMSAAARRLSKPFNQIDSTKLRILLRGDKIAAYLEKCFMTLNIGEAGTDISEIATGLSPILTIYTQHLACYLNIIINSLYLKLGLANQLVPFFMNLLSEGFGLPSKVDESSTDKSSKSNAKLSEDNAGFGEGQGEVDVSKKLEYESQLDDLKKDRKDDNDSQEANQEDVNDIEAHDDGVEMTGDIDAKAQGPDKVNGEKSDSDIEDDEPIDEEELDKQMDSVDEDNKALDKELWGNDTEGSNSEAEDDEQDLRESSDKSAVPDQGRTDMGEEESQTGALEEDGKEGDDEAEKKDKDESMEINVTATDDSVEMADDTNPRDPETCADEGGQSDLENNDETQEKAAGDDSSKQMEVSLEEEEGRNMSDEESDSEDDGDGSSDDADDTNLQERSDKSAGPEQAEEGGDGIESCLTATEQKQPMTGSKKELQHQIQVDGSSEVINIDDSDDSHSQNALQVCSSDPTTNTQDNGDSREEAEQTDSVDDKSKRTLAKRSLDENDINEIKRQKIEAAAEEHDEEQAEERKAAVKNETVDSSETKESAVNEKDRKSIYDTSAKEYRHLKSDKTDAIEIIDLVDDFEDDVLTEGDADKIAQESANKLKTKTEDHDDQFSPISDYELANDLDMSESHHSLDQPEMSIDKPNKYNSNVGLLKYISAFNDSAGTDASEDREAGADSTIDLIDQIEKELANRSGLEHDSIDTDRLTRLWLSCTRSNSHLVHELCQQLQIVLQPTKMSKYKGDYKTGKRLNMRKIISYIASHYRKDKIWLRRTKPSKRAYNIALAIDNSSSMSDNNCRQMTYQSLALLAKSLSLIEAGSLSVLSFGEQVRCIHEFGNPYMDAIGSQWLSELRFNESRTCYSKLLKYACEAFSRQAQLTASRLDTQTSISQLLLIISDGRNITSEQEEVKGYLKQLKMMGVLTLFIIVDDLTRNEGKSIADVKACVKTADGLQVEDYLSIFPFPFYVLLRHMNTMPSILGEALRQWFELVSNYA